MAKATTREPNLPLYEDTFDRFWKAYPLRVGKRAAEKKFRRIMETGEVTIDEVLAGVERYLAQVAERRATGFRDLQYCHPATWLHQGRWADEGEAGEADPFAKLRSR